MDDLISRQEAINALGMEPLAYTEYEQGLHDKWIDAKQNIEELPSAQPTLYGYNIEHLALIARVMQKENLPPERVIEALMDIGSIVAIVRDEFEETLRRSVEQGWCGADMREGEG